MKSGDQYIAQFFFEVPWAGESVQLLKSREILDNKKLVHHWMLYTVEDADAHDGEVQGDPRQLALLFENRVNGAQYLLGGVPGATDLDMPDGVGLRLPTGPTTRFSLDIHYFNAGAAEFDSSGVEICVTTKKRPIEAAVALARQCEVQSTAARTDRREVDVQPDAHERADAHHDRHASHA